MRVPKNYEHFSIETFTPNHEALNLQNSVLTLTLISVNVDIIKLGTFKEVSEIIL